MYRAETYKLAGIRKGGIPWIPKAVEESSKLTPDSYTLPSPSSLLSTQDYNVAVLFLNAVDYILSLSLLVFRVWCLLAFLVCSPGDKFSSSLTFQDESEIRISIISIREKFENAQYIK